MNLLSHILMHNLSHKLKINSFVLEEKNYAFNLSKLVVELSIFGEETKLIALWKNKCLKTNKNFFDLKQTFVVLYVITVTFSKANVMIHISDTLGNVIWFCSSGHVNITGKRKKQKKYVVLKLILFLFKKINFLTNKPVALHLNNVGFYQTFIVKKLKKKIFLKIVRNFNQIPYNGCRQKKIRRKKYSKHFR